LLRRTRIRWQNQRSSLKGGRFDGKSGWCCDRHGKLTALGALGLLGERRESGRRSLACHATLVAILLIASFLAYGSLDIAGSQAEQASQPERNVRLRVSTIGLESL
jgi:hypothetical protein